MDLAASPPAIQICGSGREAVEVQAVEEMLSARSAKTASSSCGVIRMTPEETAPIRPCWWVLVSVADRGDLRPSNLRPWSSRALHEKCCRRSNIVRDLGGPWLVRRRRVTVRQMH